MPLGNSIIVYKINISADSATRHNMDKTVRRRVALPHDRQVPEGALRGADPYRWHQHPHHPHHHPNKVLGGVRRHRGGCGDHGQEHWQVPRIRLCEWRFTQIANTPLINQLLQVIMSNKEAAERACKEPNPIIDGRKANVNLAILGAKPRGNLTGNLKKGKCNKTRVSFLNF